MKYWLFLVIAFVLFSQCRPDASPVDTTEETTDTTKVIIDTPIYVIDIGKSFTLKNGSQWNVPFKSWYHDSTKKYFLISAKKTTSGISESMRIEHIPLIPGKYAIEYSSIKNFDNHIPEAYYGMVYELDQPIGDFNVDTTRHDHFIEVIRYDSIKNTVEGRFQVFLEKAPMSTDWPGLPDSMFFTEGKFHLRIQKP